MSEPASRQLEEASALRRLRRRRCRVVSTGGCRSRFLRFLPRSAGSVGSSGPAPSTRARRGSSGRSRRGRRTVGLPVSRATRHGTTTRNGPDRAIRDAPAAVGAVRMDHELGRRELHRVGRADGRAESAEDAGVSVDDDHSHPRSGWVPGAEKPGASAKRRAAPVTLRAEASRGAEPVPRRRTRSGRISRAPAIAECRAAAGHRPS